MNNTDLAWAAGLFVGEGSFFEIRRGRKNDLKYLALSINMCDLRAVERFAKIVSEILGQEVKVGHGSTTSVGNPVFRVAKAGRAAERIGHTLVPWMDNTDKADQFRRILSEVARPEGRRLNRVQAGLNPNAKLTAKQVAYVRRTFKNNGQLSHKQKYGNGTAKRLAKKFGVSVSAIHHVARGFTW